MKKTGIVLVLLLLSQALSAASVEGIRVWSAPDHTRLVFDLSDAVDHRLTGLRNPDRLVVDFEQARLNKSIDLESISNRHLIGVRYAQKDGGALRIVLDLHQEIRPRSFLLKPGEGYGHRLVLDLHDLAGSSEAPQVIKTAATDPSAARDLIIAVDAGHGGDDPGARGRVLGSREKDVTLAIARRLKKVIDATPGMRAVLVREGDYFVPLRRRMQIARSYHADLFVSIHADAFQDKRAKGASVFVLSSRGASSEAARWLAERENASDLVGGVSLDDKDDVLASVLLDLSQSATQEVSLEAARGVHTELRRLGAMHGNGVQRAGFMVLKSPDIPSMLVETGFISNPEEERKLNDTGYQESVARAVLRGIERYFRDAPPPGTKLAMAREQRESQRYVIKAGDTLSGIASRYRVSLVNLRRENGIQSDRIRVGQVLVIPDT